MTFSPLSQRTLRATWALLAHVVVASLLFVAIAASAAAINFLPKLLIVSSNEGHSSFNNLLFTMMSLLALVIIAIDIIVFVIFLFKACWSYFRMINDQA